MLAMPQLSATIAAAVEDPDPQTKFARRRRSRVARAAPAQAALSELGNLLVDRTAQRRAAGRRPRFDRPALFRPRTMGHAMALGRHLERRPRASPPSVRSGHRPSGARPQQCRRLARLWK